MIYSTAMLLDFLGRSRNAPNAVAAAKSIELALELALGDPATRTRDIRGTAGTTAMTDAIVSALA
jgi:3-isopropylmalate dehydrogenase